MSLLTWMGLTFARFVAFVVMVLGAWVAVANGAQAIRGTPGYTGWVLLLVLFTGLAGAAGGLLYLASFDGPRRFRTERHRLYGWVGMLISAMLPTSLTLMLVPMVAIVFPRLSYLRIEDQATPISG